MSQGFTSKSLAGAGNGITDVFINGAKQATTSGTQIDFTIPSGVKEFKICMDQVSMSTTASIDLKLGDAGGVESTGYEQVSSWMSDGATGAGALTDSQNNTTHFQSHPGNRTAAFAWTGLWHFVLMDAAANTWAASWSLCDQTQNYIVNGAGSKSLSGELTTLQIGTSAGSFDNGSVNIQYDNPDPTTISTTRSGIVVQTVHTQDGAVATGTGTFPVDNTIPQITEGTEFLSASITPKNVANKLRIDVVMHLSASIAANITGALFQDSTADALAAEYFHQPVATGQGPISFTYWMDAGTTSSTTFSARGGTSSASTTTFNGSGGGGIFNGVFYSSITITEYAA